MPDLCGFFYAGEVYNTLYNYIFGIVIGTVVTALAALAVIIGRIKQTVVRPIEAMAKASADFVELSHNTQEPTALSWQKPQIACRDEALSSGGQYRGYDRGYGELHAKPDPGDCG